MNHNPCTLGYMYATGLFFIVLLFFSSCTEKRPNEDMHTAAIDFATAAAGDPKYQVNFNDSFLNNLPTPFEISRDLQAAGVEFQDDATNPANNDKRYITTHKKALNLGVYSTDLTYSLFNEQFQESINYYQVIERLTHRLGLMELVEANEVGKRFEDNIGQVDSLEQIILDFQINARKEFTNESMHDVHILYFTGAWIEALFLGTSYITAENEDAVVAMVIEQFNYLPSLKEEIGKIESPDNTVKMLETQLKALDALRIRETKKLQNGENMNFGLIRGNISLIRNSVI